MLILMAEIHIEIKKEDFLFGPIPRVGGNEKKL